MDKNHYSLSAYILLSIVMLLAICGSALAHMASAPWPRVAFTVQDSYDLTEEITVEAASTDADYISWRLFCDGKEVPVSFSDTGGSFTPIEVGNYVLRAAAHRGIVFTTCTKRFVVGGTLPYIRLTENNKAYTGEPFKVYIKTHNIPLDVGDDYFKWEIRKDGVSYMDLKPTNGTITISEPGIYTIYARGYDTQHINYTCKSVNLLVVDRCPDGYRAGATITSTGPNRRFMYSWAPGYISQENEDKICAVMEALDCDTIYQKISSKAVTDDVVSFLSRCQSHGYQVYYLCGDSSWATEPDAASMHSELNRVIAFNKAARAAGVQGFCGIHYDIEKLAIESTMNQLVKNYKTIYPIAKNNGILVGACIGYELDSAYGYTSQVEDLIANGCDSIAIMNYRKLNSEPRHLSYELELCRQYKKEIVNITEMQPVGSHNLTSDNTYHDDGIEAVEKMWGELESVFDYPVGFAYHYLDPIAELLGLDS